MIRRVGQNKETWSSLVSFGGSSVSGEKVSGCPVGVKLWTNDLMVMPVLREVTMLTTQ